MADPLHRGLAAPSGSAHVGIRPSISYLETQFGDKRPDNRATEHARPTSLATMLLPRHALRRRALHCRSHRDGGRRQQRLAEVRAVADARAQPANLEVRAFSCMQPGLCQARNRLSASSDRSGNIVISNNMASLAQPRGNTPLQAFRWGSPAKTLRSPCDIIASNFGQINKSFTVKLSTMGNYPSLL
jgi:hypothetical protein